jgi:crotonobetainyl-CoA:carnitine CoA-transferase CaiB-like acyl-CoA transferase
MNGTGSTYTKRHGFYWLLAAIGAYMATQGWFGEFGPATIAMAWVFAGLAGLTGVIMIGRAINRS